jgi:PTH1 family peptidyl-tRNA hydrolase
MVVYRGGMMELAGLIVGLGNPGEQYRLTRHNYGFMLVEALLDVAGSRGQPRRLSGTKDAFSLWRTDITGLRREEWLLAMPLTFMNRSGDAVQRIAAYYHMVPEDILVLHDELDLPLGRMKLKKGGGNAGHNGLKSIQQMLGAPDFYRLRLGVGKAPGHDGASFVLGRFREEEKSARDACLKAAVEGVILFATDGPKKAQQFCNGFSPEDPARENPAIRPKKPDGSETA